VTLVVRPRSPALAPFVASLGYVGGILPPGRERVLPSGTVSLLVNLHEDEFRTYEGPDFGTVRRTHGAVLVGPRERHSVIDTEEQRCLVDVSFTFGGASRFFPVQLSETRDELVELEELWGRDGSVLRERLLETGTPEAMLEVVERALLDHVVRPLDPEPGIDVALAAFECGVPVADVAERVGMLPKTFVRRFRDRVGLAPKRFSRVRRLQRVLRAVAGDRDTSWAQVAAEHGYCDQSHLIQDFRELAGMTPTAYRARSSAEHNHVPLAAA
jgi:AraC-like DNA-binding protein